jgi:phage terminase large subunit
MPKIQIPDKLLPILTTDARIIVLIGGRSSAKSETVGRILLMKCQTEGADILCGREYQNSIEDSVHKLLKNLITKLDTDGFNVTDKKIDHATGGGFRFKGFARNPEAVKSAQDFKYSWFEEAQYSSQASIDDILPTIRAKGSKLFFTANPQSSADPFSQRFIVPFQKELDLNGYYEDDMHLIIKINWRDNPWHGELEQQRLWDYQHLPRAKYDWIWEGAFNDSTENPLIYAEWFDACVDAHKKLGIDPIGIRMAAHDPSDTGPDHKGFAYRHGSVVLDVQQKIEGDINEGCDWALNLALQHQVDSFTWDCDGMGVGLNRQVQQAFGGKHTILSQFKGSEGVDFPEKIYMPAYSDGAPIQGQKTNKDALKNKRAQYYFELRNRIYKTYEAVEKGKYHDPDELISFDGSIKLIAELRAELCRMPIKPNRNGLFTLYTKQEMKDKFSYPSPNLGDSVMMLMKVPTHPNRQKARRPQPMRVIRSR